MVGAMSRTGRSKRATSRSDGASPTDAPREPIKLVSTTWETRRVRINRAPQASVDSAPKALRWRRLPPRDPRKPLTCTVKWRGGPEAWIEVHARGDIGRFPGSVCIADLVMWMNSHTS